MFFCSTSYHEGIRCGDLLLAINNEELSIDKGGVHLDTQKFGQICTQALLRDGSIVLHLQHSEHRAEHHHDVIPDTVHKGFSLFCGGGCCRTTRTEDTSDKYNDAIGSTKSYADAV